MAIFNLHIVVGRQLAQTIGMTTGKWYCEFSETNAGGTANPILGIIDEASATYLDAAATGYGYRSDGVKLTIMRPLLMVLHILLVTSLELLLMQIIEL
jgi:hypothetical protein